MPDFEAFKSKGWFENAMPSEPQVLLKGFRDDLHGGYLSLAW